MILNWSINVLLLAFSHKLRLLGSMIALYGFCLMEMSSIWKFATAPHIAKPSQNHIEPSMFVLLLSYSRNGRLVWFLSNCRLFNIQYGFRQSANALTIFCVLTRLYEMHYQNINVICLSLFDFENNFRNQCVMWLTQR